MVVVTETDLWKLQESVAELAARILTYENNFKLGVADNDLLNYLQSENIACEVI